MRSPILAMTTCQTCPQRPHSASMSSPTPGVAIDCTLSDVSRIAVLAEHLAEDLADLAQGRLSLRCGEDRVHDVVFALARAPHAVQRGGDGRAAASRAQLLDASHLLALRLVVDLQRREAVLGVRGVPVDADDHPLAAVDLL